MGRKEGRGSRFRRGKRVSCDVCSLLLQLGFGLRGARHVSFSFFLIWGGRRSPIPALGWSVSLSDLFSFVPSTSPALLLHSGFVSPFVCFLLPASHVFLLLLLLFLGGGCCSFFNEVVEFYFLYCGICHGHSLGLSPYRGMLTSCT